MAEFVIAGKRVKFRDKLPVKDNWDLMQKLAGLDLGEKPTKMDWKAHLPIMCRVIEEWEFEGDPSDPEAYGNLDLFREFLPLLGKYTDMVGKLVPGEEG